MEKKDLKNVIQSEKHIIIDSSKVHYNDAKLERYCRDVEHYSIFNILDIGPIIADLFTVFKGDVYTFELSRQSNIYKSILKSNTDEINLGLYGKTSEFNVQFCTYLTILKKFYTDDLMRRYSFIRYYINFVINYRIKNGLISIDRKELYKLEQKFILNHYNEINNKGEQTLKKTKELSDI